jgi:hypothetical protein
VGVTGEHSPGPRQAATRWVEVVCVARDLQVNVGAPGRSRVGPLRTPFIELIMVGEWG